MKAKASAPPASIVKSSSGTPFAAVNASNSELVPKRMAITRWRRNPNTIEVASPPMTIIVDRATRLDESTAVDAVMNSRYMLKIAV
jgi:hypothetical protein